MMKRLLFILFAMALIGVHAQEQKKETKKERQQRYIEEVNPFKELGYKPRISTLSKGKYREAFPDTILQIGSFTYNRLTQQITGIYIIEKTQPSEADLRVDIVSRWMSPDPLSQEFPDKSPYTFTNNNPIYFTDPTGLAPQGLDNDYGVDSEGNITLIKKTDDNFDRLYAVDDNGNKIDTNGDGEVSTSDSEKVNDQTILPELEEVKETKNIAGHGEANLRDVTRSESSQNDLFKIFNFAANNSNVEWSLYRFNVDGNTQFNLGTFGNNSVAPGGSYFEQSQIVAGIHSHPGIPATRTEELGALYGDRGQTSTQIRNNGQASGLKYVYYPNSNNIYNINNQTAAPSFIRNTKGNYKRFFFGTLNTK